MSLPSLRLAWLLAMALLLGGCGGGGGGGGDPGPGEDDPPPQAAPDMSSVPLTLTRRQRADALAEMQTTFSSLNSGNVDQDNEQMLAYLRSRADIADAGLNADRSLWARFIDGLPIVIINNRWPAPPGLEAQELHEVAPTALPEGDRAVLLNVQNLGGSGMSSIAAWLGSEGFNVRTGTGSMQDLRGMQDVAVLHFSTHGGEARLKNGAVSYVIGTGEVAALAQAPTTEQNENWAEYEAGLLVLTVYSRGGDGYWSITPDFVSRYWRFKPNALVFMDACSSADPNVAGPLRSAIENANAGYYLGWTAVVSASFAEKAALYFFDRILGANSYEKQTPPQRPFPYIDVFTYMLASGKGVSNEVDGTKTWQARLSLKSFASTVGVIRPTIKYMEVDEQAEELLLYGKFGPTAGTATIGGVGASVVAWTEDQVRLALPRTASGDVELTKDGRKSNVVPLTSWAMPITYTVDFNQLAFGLRNTVSCDYRLRADVHEYREMPDQAPAKRIVHLSYPSRDSACTYDANSQGISEGGMHIEHSGGGALTWWSPGIEDSYFSGGGYINTQTNTFTWHFDFSAPVTMTITYPPETKLPPHTSTIGIAMFPILGLNRPMSDYSVAASTNSGTQTGVGTATISWGTLSPISAPTPETES